MFKGLLIALVSMALWGLIFVLPIFVPQFSSFEVAMGRFISYGLVSLIYLAYKGNLRSLPFFHWKYAAIFAMTSSLVYYFLIVIGIRCLGVSFATAYCSFLPVMLSIYGNYRSKVFAWRTLTLPLAFLCTGLLFMHWGNLTIAAENQQVTFFAGLISVTAALLMWAWYSVNNAEFLTRNPEIPSSLWSSFMGVFCLIGGVIGLGGIFLFTPEACHLSFATSEEMLTYLGVSFINGFCASWLTLFLWNRASRLVPMAVLGQMGVFEVLFGLIYYYLIVRSMPTLFETVGVGLILTGLFISFRKFAQEEKSLLNLADF